MSIYHWNKLPVQITVTNPAVSGSSPIDENFEINCNVNRFIEMFFTAIYGRKVDNPYFVVTQGVCDLLKSSTTFSFTVKTSDQLLNEKTLIGTTRFGDVYLDNETSTSEYVKCINPINNEQFAIIHVQL